ncbi:hypothetical protein CFD26_100462 [Aspergillus turcosus]|uniref:Uncharacterized protein n=1 Tax=Aspergillus turcosus TaxID=1245748 RepID=A0A3R7LV69_9EURO|nr:hypothetical protein CFD26_100462 [Aspergillus turcosus]
MKLLNTSLVATRLKCIGTIVLTTSKIVAISNLFLLAAAVVAVLAAPSPLAPRCSCDLDMHQQTAESQAKQMGRQAACLQSSQSREQLSPRTALRQPTLVRSSYPHWFTNGYDGDGKLIKGRTPIKFGKSDCYRPPKHSQNGMGKNDHYLLEFPTFSNGHDYKFDSKKPKEDPGPAGSSIIIPTRCFAALWPISGESGRVETVFSFARFGRQSIQRIMPVIIEEQIAADISLTHC